MSFLYPYVLIALVLPLLLGVGLYLLHVHRRGNWEKLVSTAHHRELVRKTTPLHSVVPLVTALLALACCIIAAARPYNGYKNAEGGLAGRNIIIAIDISRSMETRDVPPSRLKAAISAAHELIDALPTDKIGLIVFSGDTELAIPLTYDHRTLHETVKQVNRNWETYGGSDLEKVLSTTLQTFGKNGTNGANALILLSDGEDTMNFNPALLEEARKQNLLIMSVGIGTAEGAAIPDAHKEGALWQDHEGKNVISKLQPETLNMLARETGGDFFILNKTTDLIAFAQAAAEKLDRHEEKCSISKIPNDIYEIFAVAAFLLTLTSILTATRWRSLTKNLHKSKCIICAAAFIFTAQSLYAAPKPESIQAYKQAQIYKAEGKVEECAAALSQALLDADPLMQAAALHCLGNLRVEQTFSELRALYQEAEVRRQPQPTAEQLQDIVSQLENDCRYYQSALAANPSFTPTATNLAAVTQLINKLKQEINRLRAQQPEQPQQDTPQDDPQEDKKDDQQDDQSEEKQDNQQDNRKDDKQEDQQEEQQDDQQDGQQDDQQEEQQGAQPPQQEKKPENQQQNSSDKRQEEQKNNQQPSDRKQQPSAEKRAQQKKQQARDFLNMNRDEEAEDEARYSKRVFDLKNQRIKPNKDY